MNDNAKKWVEALRSGEYKQGKNYLSSDNYFCCLGVACDLYQKSVGDLRIERGGSGGSISYNGRNRLLPADVQTWLNLADDNGSYANPSGFVAGSLTERNDVGYDFDKIADIIESEPPGLFRDMPALPNPEPNV